nr:immunoglobulin heavy chain junction region [Mus musculus]
CARGTLVWYFDYW